MLAGHINDEFTVCYVLHSHYSNIPNLFLVVLLMTKGCYFDNDTLRIINQQRGDIQIRLTHIVAKHLAHNSGSLKGNISELAACLNYSLDMVDCLGD